MIPIIYILINFIHAIWHWFLIVKKKQTVKSFQKVAEYTILSLTAGLILKIGFGCPVVPLILFCVLSRLAFFDGFLNTLRGKSVLYEGDVKKKKSFWDWFERQTGISIVVLRIFYLVIYLVYLIIFLI